MLDWSIAWPAIGAAFFASLVEVVEAFTIILAVATLRGWRPAVRGIVAALAILAAIVLVLGPVFDRVPLRLLQSGIGILLIPFGIGWLRKAILRAADIVALHDEAAVFRSETDGLGTVGETARSADDWIAGIAAFKAVLLEGLEVIFIVIAVGAGRGLIWPPNLGALLACALVLSIGAAVRKPVSRVPHNALKFGVGVVMTAFGVFWTGEGVGVDWPGHDLAPLVLIVVFLGNALLAVPLVRRVSRSAAARAFSAGSFVN